MGYTKELWMKSWEERAAVEWQHYLDEQERSARERQRYEQQQAQRARAVDNTNNKQKDKTNGTHP